jgi:sarcosine oxidase
VRSDRNADLLVVGGGIVGLCTAWAAAANPSRSVTLLERVKIGHAMGSSAGDARMRVLAAYPDDSYLLRGIAAGEDWLRVERAFGRPLLQTTGCLSWGSGQDDMRAGLLRYDLPHEIWAQQDVGRAYPGVRLPRGVAAIHQPDGAIIHADRALAAFAGQATNRGVAIHEGVAVTAIRPSGHSVEIESGAGAWSAGQVVICAGPWTQRLLETVGISLSLTTTSQTVCYFPYPDPPPPGIIQYGDSDPYALPSPARGLKAALHAPGPVVEPDVRLQPDAQAARHTAQWVRQRFGDAVRETRIQVETCVYTFTADERFLIRRHDAIVVVSACSGHGFQYAPDTGRRAAALL